MARTQRPSERIRRLPTTDVGVLGLLAAILVALSLALAPRADAFVYWTNIPNLPGGPSAIGRANLDGTGVDSNFIPVSTVSAYPADLALDAEHVYRAAACYQDPPGTPPCTSGAIRRANLDGRGVEQSLVGGIDPGAVAVDAGHVYWTWSECDRSRACTTDELQAGPGGIARANLDGSGVTRLDHRHRRR